MTINEYMGSKQDEFSSEEGVTPNTHPPSLTRTKENDMGDDFESYETQVYKRQRALALLKAASTLLATSWCTTQENAVETAITMLEMIEKADE